MERLSLFGGYVIVGFIALVGLAIVFQIWTNRIDLQYLIAEKKGGEASFSRFQFLIFTFVISLSFLVLTLEGGRFPDVSADVLALLGISGGSYVLSKGIQYGINPSPPPPAPSVTVINEPGK